ncbi:MAG: hypothetical protein ABWY82_12335 [Tardiphaga sp.]
MRIRRSTYVKLGESVTLAFIPCLADQHPELTDDTPPPPPSPPKVRAKRGSHLTSNYIQKLRGRRGQPQADEAQYQATMRRIDRGGV